MSAQTKSTLRLSADTSVQGCTNPWRQIARSNKFDTVAPRILNCLTDFWKSYTLLSQSVVVIFCTSNKVSACCICTVM